MAAAALGLVAALGLTATAPAAGASVPGAVNAFGSSAPLGAPGITGESPIAVAPTHTGRGYWVAGESGGVYTYGDASFQGAAPPLAPYTFIVGIAATPTDHGYVLVASDGAVYAYGDARYLGGANTVVGHPLIVAIATTPSGKGYWLIGADGGVFTYGDAEYHGSPAAGTPHEFIVKGVASPSGDGYLLVDLHGHVYAYGDARYEGNAPSDALAAPIVSMTATPSGKGYWLLGRDGGVFTFGDAPFLGAALDSTIPALAITAQPEGGGYWVLIGKAPAPVVAAAQVGPASGVWASLRQCESGGDYAIDTGNGFYGAYQFTAQTWRAMGTGYAYANDAPYWVQDAAAQKLQRMSGWGQWPACTRMLGLR